MHLLRSIILITMQSRLNIQEIAMPAAAAPATAAAVEEAPEVSLPPKHVFFWLFTLLYPPLTGKTQRKDLIQRKT